MKKKSKFLMGPLVSRCSPSLRSGPRVSYMIYFNPFGELIHRYKGVCESTFSFIEWTYQI
jgi:hypothetical protein